MTRTEAHPRPAGPRGRLRRPGCAAASAVARLIAASALVAVAGCTSATPTYFANGRPGYVVRCSGWYDGTAAGCFQRAGQICGAAGYGTYTWQGVPAAFTPRVRTDPLPEEAGVTMLIACNA